MLYDELAKLHPIAQVVAILGFVVVCLAAMVIYYKLCK